MYLYLNLAGYHTVVDRRCVFFKRVEVPVTEILF
jgi:hypothetical protein